MTLETRREDRTHHLHRAVMLLLMDYIQRASGRSDAEKLTPGKEMSRRSLPVALFAMARPLGSEAQASWMIFWSRRESLIIP